MGRQIAQLAGYDSVPSSIAQYQNGNTNQSSKHEGSKLRVKLRENSTKINGNTTWYKSLNENGDINSHVASFTIPLEQYALQQPDVKLDRNGNTEFTNDAKLIGIEGKWYDITTFIAHHPGGPVIELFAGKDATDVFKGFHQKDVLKHRKPVGTYTRKLTDPSAKAFAALHQYFIKEGYFKTSCKWYLIKLMLISMILATCFCLVACTEQWYYHCLAAFFLAGFWQQCGFLMHDSMHTQLTHNLTVDRWLGTFFGTVCFGVNGSWWRAEHFIHHSLTNTVDYGQGFYDPQIKEAIWAQNEKLFPFYKEKIHYLFIKIQHFTFLPICVFAGRIGIIIDSFIEEITVREWCACVLHWTWTSILLSLLPTWREVFVFYYMASVFQGILHIQLLISHYCKPFYERHEICDDINWYRMQIESNINILNPWWLDWFHGGLNFHIEHHLFPTMPRHNYRKASEHIKRVCKEVGIEYDECGWFETIKRTLKCLKKMSKHFKMDPR